MTMGGVERKMSIGLLAFGAVSAVSGGIALLAGTVQFPAEWLAGTIFSSYTIPGLILAVVVGGSQLVALYAGLRRPRWAEVATGVAGAILAGWIIGEILIVGSEPGIMRALQAIYALNGLLEMMLGVRYGGPVFRARGGAS